MNLESRIACLEHRCRVLTSGLFASLIVLGLCFLVGASQPTEESPIRTRSVEIVDAQGKVRVQLGHVEDDTYGVLVSSQDGKARTAVMAGSLNGSGVAILSASGSEPSREGVSIMADADSAGISIRDDTALRAGIFVEGDKQQLQLRDAKQELVFMAPSGDKPIGEED